MTKEHYWYSCVISAIILQSMCMQIPIVGICDYEVHPSVYEWGQACTVWRKVGSHSHMFQFSWIGKWTHSCLKNVWVDNWYLQLKKHDLSSLIWTCYKLCLATSALFIPNLFIVNCRKWSITNLSVSAWKCQRLNRTVTLWTTKQSMHCQKWVVTVAHQCVIIGTIA